MALATAGTSSADPPVSPDSPAIATATITTTASAKLYVAGAFEEFRYLCAPSGLTCQTEVSWGLYVDGTPVPGTLSIFQSGLGPHPPGGSVQTVRGPAVGLSGTLPAGAHTVTLSRKVTTTSGTLTLSDTKGSVTAIAVSP